MEGGKHGSSGSLWPGTYVKDATYLFFILAISGELGGDTSSLYDVAFEWILGGNRVVAAFGVGCE